ncbi:MAG: alanine racemase, partial [Candidatus Accumulibacter sp.]|nr:alanine racemase [Accumulibacter sp.]
ALRDAGLRQPILLLEGFFDRHDLAACAGYGLTPAVQRLEQLRMIRDAVLPARLPIYLKLNTGMNRLGFRLEEMPAVRRELADMADCLALVTLMTHFATADGERGVDWQLERFRQMTADLKLPPPLGNSLARSLANSAALLRYPSTVGDWARPGILLYGASPFADESAASFGLRPAMTLASHVLSVQEIGPGERVGYGGTFEASRPMRVGVVACGYADGYPRHAPSGTPILVAGARTATVGRVSMDMLACDLTDIPAAGPGSEVVLWGEGLAVDEVAAAAGTIGYELLCALARRVPVIEAGGG